MNGDLLKNIQFAQDALQEQKETLERTVKERLTEINQHRRNAISMLMSIELMINAVNLAILAFGAFVAPLRTHAAVIALTPAHAIGDGSRKLTLTVWPRVKLSGVPTARHTSLSGAISGPRMKPTTGMPTMAAATAESAMQSRPMKRRRSGLQPRGVGRRSA